MSKKDLCVCQPPDIPQIFFIGHELRLNILITAEYYRITSKYGKRGVRYAIIEAGHIGQNILLQSETMGLGAGVVGAFNDEKVKQVVNIPPNYEPLLILPVGYKIEGL